MEDDETAWSKIKSGLSSVITPSLKKKAKNFQKRCSKLIEKVKKKTDNNYAQKNMKLENGSIKFTIINELKNGSYFGEVALMTNLKRTATIFTVSAATVGYMDKEAFKKLGMEHLDLQNNLKKRLNEYKDREFKFMMTMIRNVPQFRTLKNMVLRNVLYVLRERYYPSGATILRKGEVCSQSFFIKEGTVEVFVKQETNKGGFKIHFLANLTRGSCFNFTNAFMGRPSLFDFIVKPKSTPSN